jgi:hypothetical protein
MESERSPKGKETPQKRPRGRPPGKKKGGQQNVSKRPGRPSKKEKEEDKTATKRPRGRPPGKRSAKTDAEQAGPSSKRPRVDAPMNNSSTDAEGTCNFKLRLGSLN